MSEKHFHEQVHFSRSYLVPFLQKQIADFERQRVLEVGCAEAGFLHVLAERGMEVVGVELSPDRVRLAKALSPQLDVRVGDVTDRHLAETMQQTFDLIVIREVIEHVADRDALFANLRALSADEGRVYITFPPRFSAFAGHQQMGRSLLRRLPYVHLWPDWLVRTAGRLFQEHDYLIEEVLHNYRIGLSVHGFEKLCRRYGFVFLRRDLFLIRPIYRQRFGWSPKKIPSLPVLREFLATGCECLLQKTVL
ncbi:class I SAM-dependent methyltransferase [bacterium]|nr:class I SAM-dependent methyltransferase [bacterium]